MSRLFLFLAASFLLVIPSTLLKVYAQDDVKFGRIFPEDLELKPYEMDTSASAVILYDKGELNGRTLNFSRHYRVKILKKTGYEWANLIVDVPGRSSVRGFTYNLENGEVIKTKLEKESIFQEELVDDLFVLRIFMPNVKEGAIIEIEYSHFGPPFVWKFQEEIPVAYSELHLEQNTYIDFSKNMFGYEPLYQSTSNRWIGKDMPAIKNEPFTNSINNYITKMEIEVRSINIPGSIYRDYASDWDKVYKSLMRSAAFGEELKRSGYMKKEGKEIMEKYSSREERVAAAHRLIRDNIKWNGTESLYASTDLPYVYNKEKIGNSADVNLSLIALIRQMDINALPLILSTIDNGILSLATPSLSKLNYVIGYMEIDGKPYFLDATEPNVPVGSLPERCLNQYGRLISTGLNKWVNITSENIIDREVIQAEFSLENTGNVTGKINCQSENYAGLHVRDKLAKVSSEKDYLEKMEERYHGLAITNYSVTNKDENLLEPIIEEFEVEITEMVDNLGSTLAFSPIFFKVDLDNPFKSLTRSYPVHLTEPIAKKCVVKIKLPDGYSFVDLPKPVNVSLPENAGRFIYTVNKVNEYEIQIYYKLDISKTVFLPDEYPYLQKLHSIIIDNLSQHILIKSKT